MTCSLDNKHVEFDTRLSRHIGFTIYDDGSGFIIIKENAAGGKTVSAALQKNDLQKIKSAFTTHNCDDHCYHGFENCFCKDGRPRK